jgi:C-terminal processing protease CtpA/Prc
MLWNSIRDFTVHLTISTILIPVGSTQCRRPQYVTGLTLYGGSKLACPVFVGDVAGGSPASKAGMKPGDRIVAIDGNRVSTLDDAFQRLPSNTRKPVMVQFVRDDKVHVVTVQREDVIVDLQRDGKKMLTDGSIVPSDATAAEIQYHLGVRTALEQARGSPEGVKVVFPGHYPENKQLYYPGFELFVWDNGNQVTVGGIEDGPASSAGVRWGDRIAAVDGVDPRGKSIAELESYLSSPRPKSMTLVIQRGPARKTFAFELVQAATILRNNRWRVTNGRLVPLWLPDEYLPCFD